jgi:L-lactate dehydrogenase complex protein LldE
MAAVALLERLSVSVDVPLRQSCCAQMHVNAGQDVATKAGDEALLGGVRGIAARTYELTEFLLDVLGVTDVGACFPHRVTYHPTCHPLRLLHATDGPLRLLRAVRGIAGDASCVLHIGGVECPVDPGQEIQ